MNKKGREGGRKEGREGGPYLKVGFVHPSEVGDDVALLPVLVLGREGGREGGRVEKRHCGGRSAGRRKFFQSLF